jgi:peptide/nickel transport system substrate-binding protein
MLLGMATLLIAMAASSSTRPHYGGTVRVLLQHKISSLDPLVESDFPADRDKLTRLLFESLTEIDAQGRLRPRLASSWQVEAGQRVWQFQLRLASFHDRTAVTAASVAGSLKSVIPDWKISVINKQTLTIETPMPSPHLPELLSLPRFAIVKRPNDTTLIGSGPYKLSQWQPGDHVLLVANDDYWGGRPYSDAIDVQFGASLREHLLERTLTRDHAAQLNIDQVHPLEQTSQNVAVSRPAELLALLFLQRSSGRKPVDPRIREAIASAINRSAISNVLLQKKGAPATALLPQWLAGYEFMFPDKNNPEQARKLRAETGTVAPVSLAYDFADPVSRMVAERIAVDAREAGITVQPFGDRHINTRAARRTSSANVVLLRLPLRALDPFAALAATAEDLDLSADVQTAVTSAGHLDELFTAEHKALDDFRVVPVAHLSQAVWLSNTVHNWQQLPDGEWKLDQMWVEGK